MYGGRASSAAPVVDASDEVAQDRIEALGLLEHREVRGAGHQLQYRAGNAGGKRMRLRRRRDGILLAADDERRQCQARELRAAVGFIERDDGLASDEFRRLRYLFARKRHELRRRDRAE